MANWKIGKRNKFFREKYNYHKTLTLYEKKYVIVNDDFQIEKQKYFHIQQDSQAEYVF